MNGKRKDPNSRDKSNYENLKPPLENGGGGAVMPSFRELRVLTLASQGMSTLQIAGQLNLSTRTVEKHRDNVMGKMKTANITHAVAIALRKGWIK